MSPAALLLALVLAGSAHAQSNYAQQGNSVEYDGQSGLPDQATLNGRVSVHCPYTVIRLM